MNDLRRIERQLQSDHAAVGVPDDVRPLDPEMPQQRGSIGRLLADADGCARLGFRAPGISAAVIADQSIPGECRLAHDRHVRGGNHAAVNEENGLALATNLVLQLATFYWRPFHRHVGPPVGLCECVER